MYRLRFHIAIIVAVVVLFAAAAPAVDRGAAEIGISGGSQGKVPFPHARHQDQLDDCKICHQHFPQETAAIEKMKAQDRLKPKQVMNGLCIACHRQDKQAGKPHGPLTCSTCHRS